MYVMFVKWSFKNLVKEDSLASLFYDFQEENKHLENVYLQFKYERKNLIHLT